MLDHTKNIKNEEKNKGGRDGSSLWSGDLCPWGSSVVWAWCLGQDASFRLKALELKASGLHRFSRLSMGQCTDLASQVLRPASRALKGPLIWPWLCLVPNLSHTGISEWCNDVEDVITLPLLHPILGPGKPLNTTVRRGTLCPTACLSHIGISVHDASNMMIYVCFFGYHCSVVLLICLKKWIFPWKRFIMKDIVSTNPSTRGTPQERTKG